MAIRNIPLKMGGQQIQGLGDAVDANDAVNKGQLDAATTGLGTVTSVALSGGTTGLSVSGSPITSSGTITLSGTLAVANGGTGQTSYTDGQLLIGNTTGNTLTKATLTAGTGVTITNGGGSITIAASGAWTSLFTSSNQNLTTSSTSFQNVTGLTFSAVNGNSYVFRAVLLVYSPASGSNGGGVKCAVNGPTTSALFIPNFATAAAPAYDATITSFSAQSFAAYIQFEIYGMFTASADGTFAVRAAQNSSATGASVIYKGSWLEYRSI